ncbi:MAG: hypothetical protein IT322_02805 [Anaerolineae bacterium]|nr:hypothetical protein [Anaerolineae bacterium]
MSRLRVYRVMIGRWVGMLLGRNTYFHTVQGVGAAFKPGELSGYYSDLTGKTRWQGLIDAQGIILNRDTEGNPVYFPISIIQKGLGHWDSWLFSQRSDGHHLESVLQACRWLLQHQDQDGGWTIWFAQAPRFRGPYSAMAQGEAVSLLLRAYSVKDDPDYLSAAQRALELMLRDVESGGTAHTNADGLVLEEFVMNPLNTILNGWIFALYGLYDAWLVEPSARLEGALNQSLNALIAALPRYDLGWWTYYDSAGNLSSPFYQQLHLAQLRALELTFPERAEAFSAFQRKWKGQYTSRWNRLRAVAAKGLQKLIHPPSAITR